MGHDTVLLSAVLLAINAKAEPDRRWTTQWLVLAAVFVYLSVDESVGLHEPLMSLLSPFHLTGFLLFSWIIPYGVLCIVLGVIYLSFVRALPVKFRWRTVLSAVLFVASAIGVESIEGYCASNQLTTCWHSYIVIEEGGEMIALNIFILALVALLQSRQRTVTFRLET